MILMTMFMGHFAFWISNESLLAQPTFMAASSAFATSGTTVTVPHTVGSTSNRIMIVGVSTRDRTIIVPIAGDVTDNCEYNGIPMVFLGSNLAHTDAHTYLFYLVDPPVGTANVIVTFSSSLGGNNAGVVGVVTYGNVDQINPVGSYASSANNNNSPSLSVPSAVNQVVFDVISVNNQNITAAGAGQEQRWNPTTGGNVRGAGSTKASTSSSTSMTWTIGGSTRWSMSGVAIMPIAVSDLQVTKSVNNNTPYVGQNIVFTVVASNLGPNPGDLIYVYDQLPSGYTYVSHTVSTGTYSGGTGIWDIGSLNNGSSATLTITAVVNGSGIYTNTATINGNVDDTFAGNNSDSVGITVCQAGGTVPLFNN